MKTHISRILTKPDLNNRVQIALLVHDAGLLHDADPPSSDPAEFSSECGPVVVFGGVSGSSRSIWVG
jgi:hypothetical protein